MYIYKSNNGNAYFCTSEVVNCENIEIICIDLDNNDNYRAEKEYKEKMDGISKKDRMRIWEFLNDTFKYIEKIGIIETEDWIVWFEKTDQPNKIELTQIERRKK